MSHYRITLDVTVDDDAYCEAYGLAEEEVDADVRGHLPETVRELVAERGHQLGWLSAGHTEVAKPAHDARQLVNAWLSTGSTRTMLADGDYDRLVAMIEAKLAPTRPATAAELGIEIARD